MLDHHVDNYSTHSLLDVDEVPAAADSIPLLDLESDSSNNPTESNDVHRRTGENQTIGWLLLTTPLILHFLSVIILTLAIAFYISGKSFNLDSRRALAIFAPLQSDITTAISSGVSILRIFTTMWISSIAWRCAFILMENDGISLEQINRLLTWKIHFNSRRISSQKAQAGALISIILLAAFPCQLSGPILTGSVTWTPSHGLIQGGDIDVATRFTIPDWSKYNFSDTMYHLKPDHSESPIVTYRSDTVTAAYLSFIAWPWQESSRGHEGRTMKRVTSRVAHLPVNSTLSNVTLPYFAVTKLKWIVDPWSEISEELIQSVTSTSLYNPFHNSDWRFDSNGAHGKLVYTFAFLPDNWDKATPPPPPFRGTVTETRILAGVYSQSTQGPPCSAQSPFGKIPQGIGLANFTVDPELPGCYIFAQVTYTAGASECTTCRISSWITVQNDTSLTVLPDLTTVSALDMMPQVALQMAAMNISVPNAYNNLDGYVTGLLTRSYGAAWTFLIDNLVDGQTAPVTTDVQVAVSTSKANVLWWRVLLWLMLNVLFTLSGLLFLLLQNRSRQPVAVDASIAALLLDTSDVLHTKNRAFCDFSRLVKDDEDIGYLELRQEYGGHRHVVVVEK